MRRVAILAAAALAASVVTLPSTAFADGRVRPGGNGKITVRGHGYGHGHGMSQYGAEGAARKGKSYRHILNHYYPHTKRRRTNPHVRVLITADTTTSVTVVARKGLDVRDLGDGKRFNLPNLKHSNRWRLMPAKKNERITKIQFKRNGSWHRWELPGRTWFKGDAEFIRHGPQTLVMPGGNHRHYRGQIRSASPSSRSTARDTVNVTKLDKYVQGVIAAEMPASWHQPALRAQAVAARTYAAQQRRAHRSGHYQICDTTACQVYRGLDAETSATNRAVRATHHKIRTYDGEPAFTQFSSSSGGWTSYGGYPYLPTRRDRWDGWSGNPVHTWKTRVTKSQIQRAFPRIGKLKYVQVRRRNGYGSWGGRVEKVRIKGSKHTVSVTGNRMRSELGLRSNWFTFS